ncbi:MAG: DNA polymerase III subunit gamma/tau [Firmicutes bacterium]|nr:DNA polymerase III subunit gamma/tau [Bacillota bacterium]
MAHNVRTADAGLESNMLAKEELTQEQAAKIERDFMQEGEEIRLRDGRTYVIPPLLLKDARKLMRELENIDTDLIVGNFLQDEAGHSKEQALFNILLMAFQYNDQDMTAEKLADICDLKQAKEIIRIMIGLNGLKK